MVATTLSLGLAVLLAPVFAEYAKIREKAERAFEFLAGGGVLFLLAYAFEVSLFQTQLVQVAKYGGLAFQLLGWVFVVTGSVWAAIELARD